MSSEYLIPYFWSLWWVSFESFIHYCFFMKKEKGIFTSLTLLLHSTALGIYVFLCFLY